MYARNKYKRWSLIIFTICFFMYIVIHIHQYRMGMFLQQCKSDKYCIDITHMKAFLTFALIFVFLPYFFYYFVVISHPIVDGWNVGTSRDINIYIHPNKSTTVIKPELLCKSKAFLMVIVCSSPSNFEQRIGIRESWGLDRNISNLSISVYFLLGLTRNVTVQGLIDTEDHIYGDIIQENFIDTYNNLTIKSVMLLKLIRDECSESVQFVMKTDDDTFVNLPNLIDALQKIRTPILFGKLITQSRPIRNYYDKWFVPHYMYSQKVYPSYLSGTAYVMTTDISIKLFETSLQVPLIHLEDVYLTGICAKIANIKPKMNPNFNTLPVRYNPCKYQTLITSHYISSIEMRFLYYRVKNENLERACIEERSKSNSTKFLSKLHSTAHNATSAF